MITLCVRGWHAKLALQRWALHADLYSLEPVRVKQAGMKRMKRILYTVQQRKALEESRDTDKINGGMLKTKEFMSFCRGPKISVVVVVPVLHCNGKALLIDIDSCVE